MKGELIPGLACSTEEFATTSPTRSYTPKTCKAELERNHAAEKNPEASPGDRRIRLMLQGSRLSLHPMVKKDTASRRIRPSGGKDRHSKVNTAKGPRDRRVRLSVSTAIEFYDVQDRLGYDQPSKAVEWLLREAKTAIDKLPQLHDALVTLHRSNTTPSGSPTHGHFSSSNGREEFLVGMSDVARTQHQYESGLMMQEIIGARNIVSNETPNDQATGTHTREFSSAIGLQSSGAAISSARIQLRTKARERARERAKEFIKCSIYNESGSKASCSTRPNPSSKTGHGDLLHYSKSVESHDLECMGRPDHQLENIVPRPNSHEHLQNFHLRESLQVDDRFPNTFRHDVHTEQVDDETLSIQDATRNNPIIPSPNFVHATEVHDFSHHKYQKLPNILSQPSQSRPPANTRESCSSGLLYYSSRKPLFSTPNYLDSRNMAFQHENPAPLPSCSNAISHGMAFFEVPISSGKTLSSFISPVDPTQSAFRYQTSHLAALHEDQEALISSHFPNKKILINAQSSSSGSRLTANYHMLFPQAAEVSQLAFPSAFEPFSNQTPGSVYSRTSSDFQNCEHPLFSSRDSDTLQSNALKLPARLRGLDDIEEQLKRYSHS